MSVLKGWEKGEIRENYATMLTIEKRPLDKGGCPAQFFSAIQVSVWSKNKGGGRPGPFPCIRLCRRDFFRALLFSPLPFSSDSGQGNNSQKI